MEVDRIMHRDVVKVGPDTPLADLLDPLVDPEVRYIYVVGPGDRLLGVISTLDILRVFLPEFMDANLAKLIAEGDSLIRDRFRAVKGRSASTLMTKDFVAVDPDDTVIAAEAMLVERRYNALPVVDAQGVLHGQISRKSILAYITRTARQAS